MITRDHKKMYASTNFSRWLSCLTLALFISACNPVPEPMLRIGSNTWPGYEPLYLARSLGYYDDSSVKLVEFGSASAVMGALRSRTLEGAALTLDEALTLLDDGIDLRVILVMDISDGADALVAKPGIDSAADLRGKRVAVEYTAVGAILLDRALNNAGLNVADIELVACTLDEHIECYATVDAVVTFEPYRTKLLKRGAHVLFDSSQIPGRILDVLVVLPETTETQQKSLRRLIAGYFEAREYLAAQPGDATIRMAPRSDVTPAEMLASFDGLKLPGLAENHRMLNGKSPQLRRTAADLAGFMMDKKLLINSLAVDKLADGRFLPAEMP